MTQQIIDTGEVPNDGTGDPLRQAFDKINNNFANLFALAPTANVELVDPSQFYDGGSNTSSSNFSGNITINANNIYLGSSVPAIQEDPTAMMLTFTQPIGPYYNQEYINVGATPNDGQGDPLRVAFEKINNNFSNLFYVGTVTSSTYSIGLTPNQVIFETPANMFSQASFQIRSSDTGTPDSQDITITAQISNDSANVKYTGYGTTFFGNALTRYNMDVFDGNVRLMVNPIVDQVLLHFISAQITFIGDTENGLNIALDGYTDSVMDTEDEFELTTEAS
jgi:hypothetical protein